MRSRRHQLTAAAAGAVAVALTVAVVVAAASGSSPTSRPAVTPSAAGSTVTAPAGPANPSAGPTTRPTGGVLLLTGSRPALDPAALAAGRAVRGVDLEVLSVPADEGFWVRTADGEVWVALTGGPGESPATVLPGSRVDLVATVVGHRPGFAAASGVTPAEGAARLDAARVHLAVPMSALRIRR